MSERKGVIVERSYANAIEIVRAYRKVVQEHKEYILYWQLLRSGTGVDALVREAQNAESKADFIHNPGMSQKECDESLYRLELVHETNYLSTTGYVEIQQEGVQLLKMIRSAILTTKQRQFPPQKPANRSFLKTHNL